MVVVRLGQPVLRNLLQDGREAGDEVLVGGGILPIRGETGRGRQGAGSEGGTLPGKREKAGERGNGLCNVCPGLQAMMLPLLLLLSVAFRTL